MRFAINLLLTLGVVSILGCVSHEELINFQRTNLETLGEQNISNNINLEVQPDDLLRIEISSLNMEAAAPYNLGGSSGAGQQAVAGQSLQQMELFSGYLVDRNGNIDLPGLGEVPVAGKTLEEIKSMLLTMLGDYLADPVVNIRFLNFKVTVLGEVNLPGTVRLSNKRVSVLDAIGMAGDLTLYANRSNITVIREENGQRTAAKLDLQDDELFNSPYFYLQQNDVVYIEPLQSRVATVADPVQRIVSYGTAALSLVSIIIAVSRN